MHTDPEQLSVGDTNICTRSFGNRPLYKKASALPQRHSAGFQIIKINMPLDVV